MNKADSERLESAFAQIGLSAVNTPKNADVVVLNSCVVRQSAEDKVSGMLTSVKPVKSDNPNRIIALMGCMVGPKTTELERKYPYVDVFMRPQQYDPLISLLESRMGIDAEGCIGTLTASPAITAYIPIIHGCDKFCSFCIIPYRRGREVSRSIEDIVREVTLLVERGVREVTLLGQNVDSYGHDLAKSCDLGDLLEAVNDVDRLERVRFLTSHPNDMSDKIIEAVNHLDKVCEHFNLPFQAGDDEVLRNMRRGYNGREYRDLIYKIRDRIPSASIGTDLIVGFCGESDVQFDRTLDMIRDIRFDKVHAASYSTRAGTIADRRLVDDVLPEVKKRRLTAVEDLQKEIQYSINLGLIGESMKVLVEGEKKGKFKGRSRNDKLVYFKSEEDLAGRMVNITIDKATAWSLQGTKTD
mgnify:CR=1 FL=1